MPTIATTTEALNEIYEKHESSFEKNTALSFHNLLWKLIVDEVHSTKTISLTPVLRNGRTEIGIAELNESGFLATGVGFTVKYDVASTICEDLNEKLFGQTPKLSFLIIATSMRKPEMKELGKKKYALISRAVKTHGCYNADSIMYLFEEQLTSDECADIRRFLTWVDEDPESRGFGHSNYEERFSEYRKDTETVK